MANISHASLSGSELHEPKNISTAALGTVYVSNGAGSGSWASVGTSAFTGMVADFPAPVAPAGWLECDGSLISTSTYSSLFAVLSITTSGTRTNGSTIITSIASTSTFKSGYYVFGTGIATGTTILSIDSATQVTLSAPASSSGTAVFYVSPWLMNTGTIKLPDLTTAGRFRRSKSVSTQVGDLQTDQNKAHTHTNTVGTESADHTHTYSGTSGTMNSNTTHTHTELAPSLGSGTGSTSNYFYSRFGATINTGATNTDHTHAYSGTTGVKSATHTHVVTINNDGGLETRPLAIVVLTCIKT